jgi:hypothetical protein
MGCSLRAVGELCDQNCWWLRINHSRCSVSEHEKPLADYHFRPHMLKYRATRLGYFVFFDHWQSVGLPFVDHFAVFVDGGCLGCDVETPASFCAVPSYH